MKKHAVNFPEDLYTALGNWAKQQNGGQGVSLNAAVRRLVAEGLAREGYYSAAQR